MGRRHQIPHKYLRITQGRKDDYIVYKCVLPNCNHYQPDKFMIGVQFSCYSCDAVDNVKSKSDLLTQLKCDNCRKLNDVSMTQVLSILEKLNVEDD